MTKKYFSPWVLSAVLILLTGCARDCPTPGTDPADDPVLLRARDFVEFCVGPPALPAPCVGASTRSTDRYHSLLSDCLLPDWTAAETYSDALGYITEVPMTLMRPVSYTVLFREEGDTVNYRQSRPYTRLVVKEKIVPDTTYAFLVTLLADESYEGSLAGLQADPSGTGFNGIAVYSYPDGTPRFGWRYTEGTITHQFSFDPADRAVPGVSLFLGVHAEDVPHTRGVNDNNLIEEVTVTAPYPGDPPIPFPGSWNDWEPSPPEGGGGGGNGPGSPGNAAPKKEPRDPCRNMKEKMAHPEFMLMLSDLAGLTSADYEAGRVYIYNNPNYNPDGYKFFNADGRPGEAEIRWKPPYGSRNINGFVHTHYDGLLPIFSADDLLVPGYWNSLYSLEDLSRFSMGVVTPAGTFFMQIADVEMYKNFYKRYTLKEEREKLDDKYSILINESLSGDDAAIALAKLFDVEKNGLILLKKSGNKFVQVYYDQWEDKIIEKPC